MSTFTVTIKATITKNIVVEAACPADAANEAEELFNPDYDGTEERYAQDTLSVRLEEPDTT